MSNSCAQNRHDLLAKIVEHIDGTSGDERGCNTDWTLIHRAWITVAPSRFLDLPTALHSDAWLADG